MSIRPSLLAAHVSAFWIMLTLALLAPGVWAEAPEALPSPLTLDWCIERAASANPAIAEMAALADIVRERIVPAGAFEDPRFSYEASNLPTGDFNFESTPLSGHQLDLRQALPFPGLLSARKQAAKMASSAAGFDLSDRRIAVRSAVEAAWAELGFAQRALAITERNIELLRQLARIAEAKYSVGSGLQQDVLRAQVELTALIQERLAREAEVKRSSARLGELLDLPPATAFPSTSPLDDAAPVPELGPLFEQTSEGNARLRALRAEIDSAEFALRAAKIEGYPDFDLGLGYRIRKRVEGDAVDGDDFVSLGVTIRLPVNRARWRAREAEQRAALRHAKARLRKHEASLQSQLQTTHAELVRADAEAELLRTGLVPQALQSLEASRSAYEVGRIEFLSLLDSQVSLLAAQLREVRAASDRRAAFGLLESLVGEDLR
jgi:cobalt-zinc-cadmium efflux system outer membrane protein